MRYTPCWKTIGISRERYLELLNFCRQYPQWKIEAGSLLGIRAIKADGQPHGTGKSDPVVIAAEKRDRLLAKIETVDKCAKSVGNGAWYAVIIQNVCIGRQYTKLDKALMPTSDSNTFFKVRREFFRMMDEVKDKR